MNGREKVGDMEIQVRDEKFSVNASVIRFVHRYSSMNFKRFSELGIHPAQLPVLKILEDHSGISLRELAKLLHIRPPTASVTIKRMEKSGMVLKESDERDQRISRIYLTDRGKKAAQEIEKLIRENEQLVTAGFSEEEIRGLCGYLNRMTENLVQAQQEGRRPDTETCSGEEL